MHPNPELKPRIAIYTPSHNPQYLNECYSALVNQTIHDWEWSVVLNRGALWPAKPNDPRITITHVPAQYTPGIGELKDTAIKATTAPILVELDHDDLLASDALELILEVFDDPSIHPPALVYSWVSQINADGSPNYDRFDERHGWEYHMENLEPQGPEYLVVRALDATPHNMAYIWYAPNHVRAFSREAYDAVGGYDITLEVCDDQDLMCRLYQHGDVAWIPNLLYLQRVHGEMTQRQAERNALIQELTVQLYHKHIQPNLLAWCKRNKLMALDLGARTGKPLGYEGVDQLDADGVDYVGDVMTVLRAFDDGVVGCVRAVDFLEHIEDPVALMNELYRVLAPGGMILSVTPSTDGRGAFQDPTHVSFWNENSFWYYTNREQMQYVPAIEGRFQVSYIATGFPSPWHEANNISYVTANLIAIKKGGSRQGGIVNV